MGVPVTTDHPQHKLAHDLGAGASVAVVVAGLLFACAPDAAKSPSPDINIQQYGVPATWTPDGWTDEGGGTGGSQAAGMSGKWQGTCLIESYGYVFEMDLAIEEVEGILTGDGAATLNYYGTTYYMPGELDGTSDGEQADFTLNADLYGSIYPIEMWGQVDGDGFTGQCNFAYGAEGVITLTRTDGG